MFNVQQRHRDALPRQSQVGREPDLLLVDSGATDHIINDVSKFVSVDRSFEPKNYDIELADGTKSSGIAQMKGTAIVHILDEDGNARKTYLNNALFIPSYPKNIFSVRAAAKNDAVFYIGRNSRLICKGVKFPINVIDDLYYLNAPFMCKRSFSRSTSASSIMSVKTTYRSEPVLKLSGGHHDAVSNVLN